MSSQRHGKQIEDILKAMLFPGSADAARPATAGFDIESKFDKKFGLATSIKAAKGSRGVMLADARAFWQIKGPFRLLVGGWVQRDDEIKEFYEIHEFIIQQAMLDELRGNATFSQIKSLHEGLGLKNFPQGQHAEARKWAQAQKKLLPTRPVVLNPKIDSKAQRRLQCSVNLPKLVSVVQKYPPLFPGLPNHAIYTKKFRDLILPQLIGSPPRR